MLSDLEFSDLILLSDTEAALKGVPGYDHKLLPVPEDCTEEVQSIRSALQNDKFKGSETFHFKYKDKHYRVSCTEEIEYGTTRFLRRLPETVPDIQSLGMNTKIVEWLLAENQRKGLVVFCGPQASGKTTCAAAFVAERLKLYGGHAVTYERPVEMPLSGWHGQFGVCLQKEFLREEDIGPAVEQSHRLGSPDLTYVGEIKGKHTSSETLSVALGSSEQLVVTTIHGFDFISALQRFIDFAQNMDGMAANNLAHTLLAVIRLELHSDGNRKVLRMPEFLLVPFDESSSGIRAKIQDNKLGQLKNDWIEQQNRVRNNLPPTSTPLSSNRGTS